MPARRPILKRIALWTAALLLALVLYAMGAPLVVFSIMPKLPAAAPVLGILYFPIGYYAERDLPGAAMYRDYVEWCRDKLIPRPPVIFTPPPQSAPNR